MAIIALIAALPAYGIAPLYRAIERRNKKAEYVQLVEAIRIALGSFSSRVPQGVSPSVWICAMRETHNALVNLCLRSDQPAVEERRRPREDIALNLRDPVDIQPLEWLWRRVVQMGRPGERAVEDCRPAYDACLCAQGSNLALGVRAWRGVKTSHPFDDEESTIVWLATNSAIESQ